MIGGGFKDNVFIGLFDDDNKTTYESLTKLVGSDDFTKSEFKTKIQNIVELLKEKGGIMLGQGTNIFYINEETHYKTFEYDKIKPKIFYSKDGKAYVSSTGTQTYTKCLASADKIFGSGNLVADFTNGYKLTDTNECKILLAVLQQLYQKKPFKLYRITLNKNFTGNSINEVTFDTHSAPSPNKYKYLKYKQKYLELKKLLN